jgi:polyadenylate-binding protein 2
MKQRNGDGEASNRMEDDSMENDDANENNRSRSGSLNRSKNDSKVDHDALSIYIGNVDYSANEEDLRNAFINCGEIVRVTIIKNMKTGHPKGAAFIEFTNKEGVDAAMQLNGQEVKGQIFFF